MNIFRFSRLGRFLWILLLTSHCRALHQINGDEETINRGLPVRIHDPDDDEGMMDIKNQFVDPQTAPGCPERTFDMPWIYYGEPARCYLAGSRGPCPPMMKLFLRSDRNHTGICDCEDAGQYSQKEIKFISKKKESCIKERRPLGYYPPKNRCYPLFDRGPCQRGYWLVLKKGKRVVCEKRGCPQNLLDPSDYRVPYWYYDSVRKSCYQAYTQGHCSDHQILFPSKDSHLPKCVRVTTRCGGIFTFSSDVPIPRCAPGSYAKDAILNCTTDKSVA